MNLMGFVLLAACTTSGEPASTPKVPAPATPVPSVRLTWPEELRNRDFLVTEGAFGLANTEDCCALGADCLGIDGGEVQGAIALSPSPGQHTEPPDRLEAWGSIRSGLSRSFQLRADEAIVVTATLPEAGSWSYGSYVALRSGFGAPVDGALGTALNEGLLSLRFPDGWQGERVVVVTSADPVVEAEVVSALLHAGWSARSILTDRIPAAWVELGIDVGSDSFFSALQVGAMDEEAEIEFRADPGVRAWRVTPDRPEVSSGTFDPDLLPERGTGNDELAWAASLDALGSAIEASYPNHFGLEGTVTSRWVEPLWCMVDAQGCSLDTHDTLVVESNSFTLEEDTFVVAYGVNHAATGKATAGSVQAALVRNDIGMVTQTHLEMPGTASGYLPNDPLVGDLFAVVISRDCSGHPAPCYRVAESCAEGGALAADRIQLRERAIQEPETLGAPLPEELLLMRVIKFFASP